MPDFHYYEGGQWHARTPSAPPDIFVGLDLGQSVDYSALAIVERHHQDDGQSRFDVRHLQRWPLGSSYPRIVQDVAALLRDVRLGSSPTLAVDYTGVGRPVVDLLLQAGLPGQLVPVSIHGGEDTHRDGGGWSVPKRDLVAVVQVALQTRRLRIAPGLLEASTLTSELQDYRVQISTSGHDSYGAREGAHDDLLLALCCAVWVGDRGGTTQFFF